MEAARFSSNLMHFYGLAATALRVAMLTTRSRLHQLYKDFIQEDEVG
jgi:hypothetical protein